MKHYFKKTTSPLGELYLICNDRGLTQLETQKTLIPTNCIELNHSILTETQIQLDEYFKGLRTVFDLPLEPSGTAFQKKTWNTLLQIPFGKVWSYGEQAKKMNMPKASRAVGGANGKNPIPIIIPCHRVVGSSGKLTGFSSGIPMKIFLLKHEGVEVDEAREVIRHR